MADYLGDFAIGKSVQHKFMTVNASGKPTTLGDSPTLLIYANGSVSGVASGLTLTTDFDTKTGLNHVTMLATSSVTGITSGAEYQIVIATGSVSGVSLAGFPICDFSLMNRSALMPATAGRNLLVSSTGYAGIDWSSIGTPGATVSLSATTLFTATNVTNNVGAVVTTCNTVVPANVTAASTNIGAVVTASNINIGAIVTAFNTIAPANVTSSSINIGAIVTASNINIGAVVTACNTVVPANVTAASLNIGAVVTAIATTTGVQSSLAAGVWDALIADHLNAGSTGQSLNAAGSAGDPWTTSLPGAYTTAQAGGILGTVVQNALTTIQASVTAIQAKTTSLGFTVTGQVDANVQYVNDTQVTGTGALGNEWGPV